MQRSKSFGSYGRVGAHVATAGGKLPLRSRNYKLTAKLGEGVTATVYLATCEPLGLVVAIKQLDLKAVEEIGGLDVVMNETALMASMSHPNVLPLLAAFVEGRVLWMVLPFYAAGSLLSIVQYRYPHGLTDWGAVAVVMREVAQGLAYMHASGRIHRDVKAANILVAPDGRVVLADFGVSAAMEAHPEAFPHLHHNPPAEPLKPYDSAGRLQRVSMQQQAAASTAARPLPQETTDQGLQEEGVSGGSSHRKMSAAEYRAALRAGTISTGNRPSLLTASLGGGRQLEEDGLSPGGSNRSARFRQPFDNASLMKQYLSRSTFVGTPCWMAPEVMAPQTGVGYGQAADIWSFGITMLEVAFGQAPTAKQSVDEILLSVVSCPEDDPTSIAGELSHTPKEFQEVVYSCLVKNPTERPTAAQMLQMRFFKNAAAPDSLAHTLLNGVPPVTARESASSQSHATSDSHESDAQLPHPQRLSRTSIGLDLSPAGPKVGLSLSDLMYTAVDMIRQLGRTPLRPQDATFQFHRQKLQDARGFGSCILKRGKGWRAHTKGIGFVVAKVAQSDQGGHVTWSAPSWFFVTASISEFTPGTGEVACIFLVRQQRDLDAFTSDDLRVVRADEGHKKRHLQYCRSLATSELMKLAIGKGGCVACDKVLNDKLYGEGSDAKSIVQGGVRPPQYFGELYDELNAFLAGEALEGSRGRLDTRQAARGVSEALARRISAASFGTAPAKGNNSSVSDEQREQCLAASHQVTSGRSRSRASVNTPPRLIRNRTFQPSGTNITRQNDNVAVGEARHWDVAVPGSEATRGDQGLRMPNNNGPPMAELPISSTTAAAASAPTAFGFPTHTVSSTTAGLAAEAENSAAGPLQRDVADRKGCGPARHTSHPSALSDTAAQAARADSAAPSLPDTDLVRPPTIASIATTGERRAEGLSHSPRALHSLPSLSPSTRSHRSSLEPVMEDHTINSDSPPSSWAQAGGSLERGPILDASVLDLDATEVGGPAMGSTATAVGGHDRPDPADNEFAVATAFGAASETEGVSATAHHRPATLGMRNPTSASANPLPYHVCRGHSAVSGRTPTVSNGPALRWTFEEDGSKCGSLAQRLKRAEIHRQNCPEFSNAQLEAMSRFLQARGAIQSRRHGLGQAVTSGQLASTPYQAV